MLKNKILSFVKKIKKGRRMYPYTYVNKNGFVVEVRSNGHMTWTKHY